MLKCPEVDWIHTYSWLFDCSYVKKVGGMSSVVRKLGLVLSGITIALKYSSESGPENAYLLQTA